MAARALIFDLDGTIWDSAGWFALALADGDAAVVEMRHELIAGGNVIKAMKAAGLSKERLLQRALDRAGAPPLFGGISNTLAMLRERGLPLGIATSLPGSLAMPMLEACGLRDRFSVVIHAGLCRSPKPSPASIRMALTALEQPPSPDVFYVGDRSVDHAAAAKAQVGFAWISHGYERPPEGVTPLSAAELIDL